MTALLEVRDLNAWYGESHVLHGVNLQVDEGETVCILGRNGMGKTTTLRSIMGIVRQRKGTITLGGRDLIAMPLHRTARTGLGFVPEERGIFATLSVEENLQFFARLFGHGAAERLSVCRIHGLDPVGLKHRSSRRIT